MSSPSKSPTMEHVQESHPHLKASVSQVNTSTGSPSPKQQQQVQHEAADRNTEASLTTRTLQDAIVAPTEVDHQVLDEEEELNNFNNNLDRQQQDAFLRSFPPGFRFNPRDEELVQYYLQKKILKEPLPPNKIMEVNLYRHNPETLAERYESYGEKEWYFFTPRDRKYPNGQRPNRKAGDGYWKATGADRPIKSGNVQVGCRKALVFYRGKPPKGTKTNWIMHEYRVSDSPTTETITKRTHKGMRLDDWVLCRIYKKAASKNNKTQSSIHEPVCVKESLSTSLPNDIEMEMSGQVDDTQAPESEGEHIVHQSYGFDNSCPNYAYTYPAYSSMQSMFPTLDNNNMLYDHQRFKPVPLSYANMLHTCGSSSRISYPDQSYSQQFTDQKRGVQFDDQRFIVYPVDSTSESMICTEEVSDQKSVVQIPNQKLIMQSVDDITSGSMFCPDQKSIQQEIGKSLLPPPSSQSQQYIEESDDDVHNFFVDPPVLPLGSLWP